MLYRRLIRAIGGEYHSPSIDRKAFGSRSFIYAQDLESAPEVQRSGVNTNSQSLSLFLEGIYTDASQKPDQVFLTSYSDTILEVTTQGVIVAV